MKHAEVVLEVKLVSCHCIRLVRKRRFHSRTSARSFTWEVHDLPTCPWVATAPTQWLYVRSTISHLDTIAPMADANRRDLSPKMTMRLRPSRRRCTSWSRRCELGETAAPHEAGTCCVSFVQRPGRCCLFEHRLNGRSSVPTRIVGCVRQRRWTRRASWGSDDYTPSDCCVQLFQRTPISRYTWEQNSRDELFNLIPISW